MIDQIENGEAGGSVRAKINASIDASNTFIGVTEKVVAYDTEVFSNLSSQFGYQLSGRSKIVSPGDMIRVIGIGSAYQVADPSASDAVLDYTGSGGVKLYVLPIQPGRYHVAQVGAVGNGNETTIIKNFADTLPAGSELHFDGGTTYTLAIASDAPIYWCPNGATFTNASSTLPILNIGSQSSVLTYAVTEGTLPYNSRSFTIPGASSAFQVGNIATLHDGRTRPSDNAPVNFFTIKIASIVGDVITVEGSILTHLQGSIVMIYSPGQIKDAGIVGQLNLEPVGTSASGVFMSYIERPRYDYVQGRNTIGPGITLRYCYDVHGGDADFRKPAATGSGQGYGVQLLGCTEGWIGNTRGEGMRHALDLESTYSISAGVVSDPAPVSTPCGVAHNGFGGHISISGYRGGGGSGFYAVAFSAQGHSGGAADPDPLFPLRNFSIGFVNVTMEPGSSVNTFAVAGVYLQGYLDGYNYIGPVDVQYTHPDMPTTGAASSSVRVNGGVRGVCKIESISGNKIGNAFVSYFSGTAGDNDNWRGTVDIGPIDLDEQARYAVQWRNNGTLIVKSAHSPAGVGLAPVQIATSTGGAYLENMMIGPVDFGDLVQPVAFTGNSRVYGDIAKFSKNATVAIQFASSADSTITADQLYTRGSITRMNVAYTPAGANHDITSFPAPRVEAETVNLWVVNAAGSVTIKASSTVLSDVVVPALGKVTMVAFDRQWVRLT